MTAKNLIFKKKSFLHKNLTRNLRSVQFGFKFTIFRSSQVADCGKIVSVPSPYHKEMQLEIHKTYSFHTYSNRMNTDWTDPSLIPAYGGGDVASVLRQIFKCVEVWLLLIEYIPREVYIHRRKLYSHLHKFVSGEETQRINYITPSIYKRRKISSYRSGSQKYVSLSLFVLGGGGHLSTIAKNSLWTEVYHRMQLHTGQEFLQ